MATYSIDGYVASIMTARAFVTMYYVNCSNEIVRAFDLPSELKIS